ncbi:hypothetical protein EST38_g6850 [Candolleomyces aberdarensis]|uniref:DUF6818 domain-containing protein n=1 Tax=Candolleomyces aberdarensis TaxID=2316362 RepID=A0A4Q2DIW3_9AGAR|nr:hypothetical protein EST38_g6850 [Candolleomyces aberdarensis]
MVILILLGGTVHSVLKCAERRLPAPPRHAEEINEEHHGPYLSSSEDVPDRVLCTPLPPDDNDNFPTPAQALQQTARPATIKAGARRANVAPSTVKGKQRANNATSQAGRQGCQRAQSPLPMPAAKCKATAQAAPADVKKHKGRAPGLPNYSDEDTEALLDILGEYKPISGKGWNEVTADFNAWAVTNNHPEHTTKSLETKYKQLVKQKKPTGDAEVPFFVLRAWEIEDAMNKKAETQDLDDEDFVDAPIEISDNDDTDDSNNSDNDAPPPKATSNKENMAQTKKKVKQEAAIVTKGKNLSMKDGSEFVLQRLANNRLTTTTTACSCVHASDTLLANLTNTLDPTAQAARAEDCAARSMQTAQILSLSSQLRESQALVENFRAQLSAAERCCATAERCADKFEMMSMIQHGCHEPSPSQQWSLNSPRTTRHDIDYPDGGHAVTFSHPDEPLDHHAYPEGTRVYDHPNLPSTSSHISSRPFSPLAFTSNSATKQFGDDGLQLLPLRTTFDEAPPTPLATNHAVFMAEAPDY